MRRQLLQDHYEMIQTEIKALQDIETFLLTKLEYHDQKYKYTKKADEE